MLTSALLNLTKSLQLNTSRLIQPGTERLKTFAKRFVQTKQSSTILEITNGVGGSEAMLFADDMFAVYTKYLIHRRWPHQILEVDNSDLGGIKSAKIIINTLESYFDLIQEAGVHRVQRVPKTERSGRMHTSTITVAVVPKSVLDINIQERDVEVQTKRASGPGGQHVNKTESAVRLVHKPSGLAVESQESRFQIDNKKIAMRKLEDKIRQLELEKLTSQMTNLKKVQVGKADRNEKIRTYNFPHDRITDHRLSKTYSNLRGFFSGDVAILERMIQDFKSQS